MMAKNLSIRFNAASSATAISSAPSTSEDPPTDLFPGGTSTDIAGHLVETPVAVIANDAEISRKCNQPVEDTQWPTALGDSNSSLNSQCSTVLNDLDVQSTLPSSEKDEALNISATKARKGASPTVGAKVDKFMRQLHESLSPASASGSKGEASSATTSWCKFDKAEGSLEIISSNQAESDDSARERVSITLTPATSTSNQGTVGGGGKSSTTSTTNSWLADMKLFRDKWAKNNEKKAHEEVLTGHGPAADSKRKMASSQAAGKMAGPAGGAGSSSSTVTVSNPYLNNNYLANNLANNHVGGHTCGSCFRRNPNSGPQPQLPSSTSSSALPFYCGCTARDADQSNTKCTTPQRTPTPPLLLSPSEVVFDPTLDPYLGAENSMLFSFKSSSSSDGKEKKEKKEKDVKKGKLFTGSSSSQSKERDSVARKKAKEEKKEKEREKESGTFMTKLMNTSRSSSVSSNNVPLTPASVSNSSNSLSFLAVTTPKNTSPTQSHYSSTENISFTGDPSFQPTLINWTSGKNIPKNAKLTTSRSMISFRKLKGDADEATLDDSESSILFHLGNDTRNSFAPTVAPTGNPTLRRKASFRRDSPTATECSNEDGLSVSSNQSSSASNGLEPAPSLSPVDASVRRSEASVFSLHSRVFSSSSWAMCFSYAYYVFAFIVALLSLLISLISPLPSFFNGLVLGFVCTFLLVTVVIIYAVSNYVLIKAPDAQEHCSTAPDLTYFRRNKPKLSINSLFNASTGLSDADSFSGWVYEFIGEYEEREKNGFVSQLVYLHLRGTKLTIFTPKEELNEKKLKQFVSENKLPSISSQRVVDFAKQSRRRIALLLTKNVRNQRKYIWSKKYPISVEFTDDRASCGGGYVVSGSNQVAETPLDSESARMPGHTPLALKFVFFGRSCKDKEEWFWAIKNAIEWNGSKSTEVSPKGSSLHIAEETGDPFPEVALEAKESLIDAASQSYLRILTSRQSYHAFMRTNVLNAETLSPNGLMSPLTWFNVLLNRLSFDILNKPNWSAYIAKKLQRKLRKLRLPYFMESLTITEIDIGTTLPKFNSVPSQPTVDEAGLWIDFDVNYSGSSLDSVLLFNTYERGFFTGGLTMTLETKLNLMKLKRRESPGSEAVSLSNLTESGLSTPISPLDSPVSNSHQQKHWSGYKCRAFTASSINSTGTGNDANEEFSLDDDSDLDSILTSSEDEEPETAPADPDDADTDVKQRKFIRFVDNIATSQWFQKATKMTFFQKAIEGVSKMSISMTVQINSLSGTLGKSLLVLFETHVHFCFVLPFFLAINIPQSPSDRLWYGFRNEPTIQITARPKLGDQHVNLQYLTNFIEKKLKAELFNYFVIPHMDDFYIPALNANIEQFISVVK